jgi:hypothetical protein
MRLAAFFAALIFAAPLFAQTQDPAPPKLQGDQATIEKLLKEHLLKLGDGKSVTAIMAESVCSVPLVKAPIGTPDQYADRPVKPSEVESIPKAVLPAPPCK